MEGTQYEVIILLKKKKVSRLGQTIKEETISRHDKTFLDFANSNGLFEWLVCSIQTFKTKEGSANEKAVTELFNEKGKL